MYTKILERAFPWLVDMIVHTGCSVYAISLHRTPEKTPRMKCKAEGLVHNKTAGVHNNENERKVFRREFKQEVDCTPQVVSLY